jgi:hypothetical protein
MSKQLSIDLDSRERRIVQNVEDYGCHVAFIRENAGLPGFAYSIGLYHNFRHPEIILFGLETEVMTRTINQLTQQIRSGKMYDAGFDYPEVLDGLECRFHYVQNHWQLLFASIARWFYEADDVPFLQCVWPDQRKKYPWSAYYRPDRLPEQPWLFREDARDAGVEGFIQSSYGDEGIDSVLKIFDERAAKQTITSACAKHRYDRLTWPFERPSRMRVFSHTDLQPEKILAVFHEDDGSWFVMSRPQGDDEAATERCLGCLAAADPSLAEIADLPRGWAARRPSPSDAWRRRPGG